MTKPVFSLPTTTPTPGYRATTKGDLDTAVNAVIDSLWDTMKTGRAQLIGSVTEVTGAGSTKTVTVSQGGYYIENNGGAVKHVIAPFGPVAIESGLGLIVDFTTGAVDGSGRYVPELVTIASALQTGWQTRDRYILVANYSGQLAGEYEVAPSVQAGLQEQIDYALISKYQINTGQLSAMKIDFNAKTVSWDALGINRGTGSTTQIASVTDRVVALGRALYIDVNEGVNPLTVQEADYLSLYPSAVRGDVVILVANLSGANPGQWLGELMPFLIGNAARNNANRSRSIVGGAITKLVEFATNRFRVSISEGRVYDENLGSSQFRYKIAPLTDVDLNLVEAIISTPNDPEDAEGRKIPQKYNLGTPATPDWQSGDAFVLVANVSNSTAGYNAIHGEYKPVPNLVSDRNIGIHDGKACFTVGGGVVTYDSNTRTLTWPETIIQMSASSSSPISTRVKLEPGSITIPSGDYWVVYLDLTQVDYTLTPNTAVAVGQYYDGGWTGQNQDQLPLFAAAENFSYPICFPPVRGSTLWPDQSEAAPYDSDEILVTQSSNNVRIYMKGGNAESSEYILYQMTRSINGANGCDVWRVNGVFAATRTGDASATTGMQICNAGEMETAIRQAGKSDFMGGNAHGDEKLFEVHMLIDGVEVPIDGSTSYRCSKVEFLQGSNLYEADTAVPQSNILAKNYKRWVFAQREWELFQHVVWEEAVDLTTTFMTMCTVQRWDTSGTIQISDKGFRSPLYLQEDIGATYGVTITAGGTGFTNGEIVEITAADGTGTGMRGTATVVSGAITEIYVNIQNGSGYTIGEAANIAAIDGTGTGAQGTLTRGFSTVETQATIAKASGPSGYSFEVEILDGWDKPNRKFWFQNVEAYNKFYFDYTGTYTTSVGETFSARARYRLSSNN